ncbi:hypothetical protein GCM10022248_25130 [Nonomuraea soli]
MDEAPEGGEGAEAARRGGREAGRGRGAEGARRGRGAEGARRGRGAGLEEQEAQEAQEVAGKGATPAGGESGGRLTGPAPGG